MLRSDEIVAFGLSRVPRQARELGERAAMRAVVGTLGARVGLIPRALRQQFALVGIDDGSLERALRNIRRPSDWPYAWEAEGDRRYAAGDLLTASSCYYFAQRVLMTQTPLKRRLYEQSTRLYAQAPGLSAPLEPFTVEHGDEQVAGLLQVPSDILGPVPLIVLVPGITATKEEFHPLAEVLLEAGFACARIDNPGYGHTTGVITDWSSTNPAAVVSHLATDPRIDARRINLVGTSMGGLWAAISASKVPVQSLTVVAAPFNTERYFHTLPSTTYTALRQMSGLEHYAELVALAHAPNLTLDAHVKRIEAPVRIIHGAKDGTVPVSESSRYERELRAPSLLTVYPRGRHNCLEHFDEITETVVDWCTDSHATLERELSRRRHERIARAAAHATLRTSSSAEPGVA